MINGSVQKGGVIQLFGRTCFFFIMTDNIFLLTGSNLGDRLFYISQAIKELEKSGIKILKKSPVYETASWGYDDRPYLNQVLECETILSPQELLKNTQKIETALGRVRTKSGYEARTIDIDILFYSDSVINTPKLVVPHILMQERRFVLTPLCDIAPEFLHPVLKKKVSQLLNECEDRGGVEKFLV